MAWTAIVARTSCAKGLYFVCKGIRPSLLVSLVDSPQNLLTRIPLSGFRNLRSIGTVAAAVDQRRLGWGSPRWIRLMYFR